MLLLRYGVAMAALGMLSTLATCLTIDGYGPISDNAGGIAEMSGMHEDVSSRPHFTLPFFFLDFSIFFKK